MSQVWGRVTLVQDESLKFGACAPETSCSINFQPESRLMSTRWLVGGVYVWACKRVAAPRIPIQINKNFHFKNRIHGITDIKATGDSATVRNCLRAAMLMRWCCEPIRSHRSLMPH